MSMKSYQLCKTNQILLWTYNSLFPAEVGNCDSPMNYANYKFVLLARLFNGPLEAMNYVLSGLRTFSLVQARNGIYLHILLF